MSDHQRWDLYETARILALARALRNFREGSTGSRGATKEQRKAWADLKRAAQSLHKALEAFDAQTPWFDYERATQGNL